jgi:hypothetical protein
VLAVAVAALNDTASAHTPPPHVNVGMSTASMSTEQSGSLSPQHEYPFGAQVQLMVMRHVDGWEAIHNHGWQNVNELGHLQHRGDMSPLSRHDGDDNNARTAPRTMM